MFIPNLAILLVISSRIGGLASWCFNQPIWRRATAHQLDHFTKFRYKQYQLHQGFWVFFLFHCEKVALWPQSFPGKGLCLAEHPKMNSCFTPLLFKWSLFTGLVFLLGGWGYNLGHVICGIHIPTKIRECNNVFVLVIYKMFVDWMSEATKHLACLSFNSCWPELYAIKNYY